MSSRVKRRSSWRQGVKVAQKLRQKCLNNVFFLCGKPQAFNRKKATFNEIQTFIVLALSRVNLLLGSEDKFVFYCCGVSRISSLELPKTVALLITCKQIFDNIAWLAITRVRTFVYSDIARKPSGINNWHCVIAFLPLTFNADLSLQV